MKKIDLNQVVAEFLNDVTEHSPLTGRKYIVTTPDVSGNLSVTIGLTYDKNKIKPTRDEVLLEWRIHPYNPVLYGKVVIEGKTIKGTPAMRSAFFNREMSSVLQALRYADRALFEKFPTLDDIPVYVHFSSDTPKLNKMYSFGTMKDYRIS